jgi:hypothetical protein
MKRMVSLLGAVLFVVTVSNPNSYVTGSNYNTYSVAASGSERTIILRVTKADSGKRLGFTGWYQLGDTPDRIHIRTRSPKFGIKLQTNSLSATFRKTSGESGLSVEVIEFIGEQEIGSVSATGEVVEVDVHPIGDGIRMTVRPVEGIQRYR